MSKGIALLVGLKKIDPNFHNQWNGENGCWGCELDVDNMGRILGSHGYHLHTLKTESATRDNILNTMSDISQKVVEDDIFVFYYSGHGGQQLDTDGDEEDGYDETLIVYDQIIIDDELFEQFKMFPDGVRIVMISDSCNSGTNYKNRRDIPFEKATPLNLFRSFGTRSRNEAMFQLIHMGGCRDGDASYGYHGGGEFTIALCQALSDKTFSGSYYELYEKTRSMIRTSQKVQYNEFGNITNNFRSEKPFTIKSQTTTSQDVSPEDSDTVLKAIEIIDQMNILPESLEEQLITAVEQALGRNIQNDFVTKELPWAIVDESFETPKQYAPFYEMEARDEQQLITDLSPDPVTAKQLELLGKMGDLLIEAAEKAIHSIPFESSGCRRDDLMVAQSMLIAGSLMLPIPAMLGGAALGGILGIIAGVPAAEGGGVIPVLAAALGAGIGRTLGATQLMLVGLHVANRIAEIDREVPVCQPASKQGQDRAQPVIDFDFDEALSFIDFETISVDSDIRTTVPTHYNYAGVYESLIVQSLAEIFSDEVIDISIHWENSRYIPAPFKTPWRAFRTFLKPAFDVLRSIKQYKRLPKGRPAQSLKGQLKWATTWINGDTPQMRSRMLEALALGHTTLRAKDGYLRWTTPPALRMFGLPPIISKQFTRSTFSFVGVTASTSPGPFYVNLGKPSIRGSLVEVSYSIEKGSSIASVAVYYTLPTGNRFYLLNSNIKTSSTIRGALYFKVASTGPVIDSIKLGSVAISMPKLDIPDFFTLGSSFISDLQRELENHLKNFGSSALPFVSIFNDSADAAKKNMLKIFRDMQSTLGFEDIRQINAVEIENGIIKVNIGGYKANLQLPPLGDRASLQSTLADTQRKLQVLS